MEIIIETIARSRKTLKLLKLSGDRIKIGRGYTNDFIIKDPFVDAVHAELQWHDGQWYLFDNHSSNGTHFRSGQPVERAHKVQSGEEIIVGKTHLRLVLPQHPVAAALKVGRLESWQHWLGHPLMAFMLAVVMVGMVVGLEWLQNPHPVKLADLITNVVAILGAALLWPLFFAGLSKIFKRESHVFAQISISFLFLCGFMLWIYFAQVLRFNVPSLWFNEGVAYFVHFWVLTGLLWFNLYIGFHHLNWMRWSIAGGLAFLVVMVEMVSSIETRFDHVSKLEYNANLLPPAFQWQQPVALDDYLNESEKLFQQVHQEAKKQPETE